jgi:hypothetical protein
MMQPAGSPETPVMIDIGRSTSGDPTGISDVLIGALGLSGALILCAFLLAILLAGGLFWWRSRVGLDVDPEATKDHHIL